MRKQAGFFGKLIGGVKRLIPGANKNAINGMNANVFKRQVAQQQAKNLAAMQPDLGLVGQSGRMHDIWSAIPANKQTVALRQELNDIGRQWANLDKNRAFIQDSQSRLAQSLRPDTYNSNFGLVARADDKSFFHTLREGVRNHKIVQGRRNLASGMLADELPMFNKQVFIPGKAMRDASYVKQHIQKGPFGKMYNEAVSLMPAGDSVFRHSELMLKRRLAAVAKQAGIPLNRLPGAAELGKKMNIKALDNVGGVRNNAEILPVRQSSWEAIRRIWGDSPNYFA